MVYFLIKGCWSLWERVGGPPEPSPAQPPLPWQSLPLPSSGPTCKKLQGFRGFLYGIYKGSIWGSIKASIRVLGLWALIVLGLAWLRCLALRVSSFVAVLLEFRI